MEILSEGVRKKLREYGILAKKFGVSEEGGHGSSHYVTPLGKEILDSAVIKD
jgi:hypothetical protein